MGGWVTIDNNSGKRYQDAKLKLIAGDVNIVNDNQPVPMASFARNEMVAESAPPSFQKSHSQISTCILSVKLSLLNKILRNKLSLSLKFTALVSESTTKSLFQQEDFLKRR